MSLKLSHPRKQKQKMVQFIKPKIKGNWGGIQVLNSQTSHVEDFSDNKGVQCFHGKSGRANTRTHSFIQDKRKEKN